MGYVIYFGSVFAFLLSFGQLVKPWHKDNIVFSSLLFCIGVVNLFIGLVMEKVLLNHPHLLHGNLMFLYMTGPLGYIYLSIAVSSDFQWKPVHILHFLPLLLSVALGLPYWTLSLEEKQKIIELMYANHGEKNMMISVGPGLAIIIGYIIAMLYENNPFIDLKNRVSWIAGVLLVFWGIASFAGVLSIFSGGFRYLPYAGVMITLSLVYLFLLSHRHPDFLYTFGRSIRRKKYERSLLKGVNTESLSENLRVLMADEKIYKNDKINLKETASLLHVSAHQLSQYLNEHEEKNFNTFVNEFRISEAKKLIQEDPDKRILTVAFDVGFNSLSAFNQAFQKLTGVSPSVFKKGV